MMNSPVRELISEEFPAAIEPIMRYAVTEIRDSRLALNFPYFSREWMKWMNLGFARTWYAPGAIAGGVFTNDLFSGDPRALLQFWLSIPAARHAGRPIKVLEAFERAAENFNAKPAAAVHAAVSPEKLAKVYLKRGYTLSELIFTK